DADTGHTVHGKGARPFRASHSASSTIPGSPASQSPDALMVVEASPPSSTRHPPEPSGWKVVASFSSISLDSSTLFDAPVRSAAPAKTRALNKTVLLTVTPPRWRG